MATPISHEAQVTQDLDWFAVDARGYVAHFTSAGFKLLPPTIAADAEALDTLTRYFLELKPRGTHRLDPALRKNNRDTRYLRDFAAMADRGLYSFDIETHLDTDIDYFRVALPVPPLHVEAFPEPIRTLLLRTRFDDLTFASTSSIRYERTLQA